MTSDKDLWIDVHTRLKNILQREPTDEEMDRAFAASLGEILDILKERENPLNFPRDLS